MSQPKDYFKYWNCNLGGLYLMTERSNQIYLNIWDNVIETYYAELIKTKGQVFDTF